MTDAERPDALRVFEGVRIADFAWVGVGPNATMQMAFHGAEVVRIESSLKPDTFRSSGRVRPGKARSTPAPISRSSTAASWAWR